MKKFFVTLLVLVSLVICVVFGLPLLLSSDAARQEISKRISGASGMKITLDGSVNLSIFPDIALVAQDVKLASPDDSLFVSITEIISSVKLSSILSGKVDVIGLSLKEPEIRIVETDRNSEVTTTDQDDRNKTANSDPFVLAIDQLERLSVKKLSISNGAFISQSLDGHRSVITNINADLRAPSLEGQIDLVLNATKDNQHISLTAAISALRSILQRQPSRFDLALKLDPAPHPMLADLTASGDILLSEDGSYQIIDGLFTSLDQPLRLDAIYLPGKRPYARLNLEANQVDLGSLETERVDIGSAQNASTTKDKSTRKVQQDVDLLDLSALVDIDADVTVKVDSFRMDNIEAREINLGATLKNGALDINLGNIKIAKGSVAAKLSADVNSARPEINGSIFASALKISDFAKLANVESPLSGNLGLEFIFGFRGLSENLIKETLELTGGVNISNGSLIVPALEAAVPSAKGISDLNFEAKIHDVRKPINIDGKMAWNGDVITFGSVIDPTEIIRKSSGPLTLSINSGKFNANYSGKVNLNGSAVGQLKLSANSLGRFMTWIGQSGNDHLGAFSYNGKISVDANSFSFAKASIALDDIKASGSGSIDMYGKPSIITDLSFGELDIVAILGGDAKSVSQKAKGKKNNNVSKPDNVPIDLSALKNFDAHVKLKAQKVLYGKVVAGPVNTTLIVKGGIAHIVLPQTPFYGGSVLADISADGSGDTPAIDIDAKMSNVNALPLFGDAASFKRIEGKLNTSIKVNGSGKTSRQFAKSLKGSSSAKFTDGAIRGVNIAKIYNNLTAIMAGGFKENQDEKTKFTELGLSFLIDQGVAVTNDIKLLGPLVRMDGAGSVDLGEEKIDMRLNPLVVASTTGQTGNFDLGGVGIPVLINGPLNNPRVYPDLKGILKNPEAAVALVSKLGLGIDGLTNGSKEPVKNLIGNLISNTVQKQGDAKIGGPENLVNSLLEQALKAKLSKSNNSNTNQNAQDNPVQDLNVGTDVTGQVPFPTLNPRRQAPIKVAPQTVEKQIIDQVAPKLKLPIEDLSTNKTLRELLNNQLQ